MPDPAITTHCLTVPRTARFCSLGPLGPETRDVWIVCHGYRQLAAEFIRPFSVLDDGGRLIAAPEGLSRFYYRESPAAVGASWMTKEDRLSEIEDYVRYLDLLYEEIFDKVNRESATLTVLGFSQGAATASRWVSRMRRPADALVLWGGLMAPDLSTAASFASLRQGKITIVAGQEDTLVPDTGIRENMARLERFGLSAELIRFPGGHRLSRQVLLQLAQP